MKTESPKVWIAAVWALAWSALAGAVQAQPELARHLPADCLWSMVIEDPYQLPQKSGAQEYFQQLAKFPLWDIIDEAFQASGKVDVDRAKVVLAGIRKGVEVVAAEINWKVLAGQQIAAGVWAQPDLLVPTAMLVIKARPGEEAQLAVQLARLWKVIAIVSGQPAPVTEDLGGGKAATLNFTVGMLPAPCALAYAVVDGVAVIGSDPADVRRRVRAPETDDGTLYQRLQTSWPKLTGLVPAPLAIQGANMTKLGDYLEKVFALLISWADTFIPQAYVPEARYYCQTVVTLLRAAGSFDEAWQADTGGWTQAAYWRIDPNAPPLLRELFVCKPLPAKFLEICPKQARGVTAISVDIVPDTYAYIMDVISKDPVMGVRLSSAWKRDQIDAGFEPEKDLFPCLEGGLMIAQMDEAPSAVVDGKNKTTPETPPTGAIVQLGKPDEMKALLEKVKKSIKQSLEVPPATAEGALRSPKPPIKVVFSSSGFKVSSTKVKVTSATGTSSETFAFEYAIVDGHLVFGYPERVYDEMLAGLQTKPEERKEFPYDTVIKQGALPQAVFYSVMDYDKVVKDAAGRLKSLTTGLNLASDGLPVSKADSAMALGILQNFLTSLVPIIEKVPQFKYGVSSAQWDGTGYLFKQRLTK